MMSIQNGALMSLLQQMEAKPAATLLSPSSRLIVDDTQAVMAGIQGKLRDARTFLNREGASAQQDAVTIKNLSNGIRGKDEETAKKLLEALPGDSPPVSGPGREQGWFGLGRSNSFAGEADWSGYKRDGGETCRARHSVCVGGTLEGPSKGVSDGGGDADRYGDYKKEGFDCSSLVRYMIHQETGVEIPRMSQAQYAASRDVSDPKPGDLVFPRSSFKENGPGHVQMYLGDNRVIENRPGNPRL